MREISGSSKLPTNKFADQNQVPKLQNQKPSINGNQSKLKSATSWGSHIVKGFSAEKKTKQQQIAVQSKKPPLSSSNSSHQKNPFAPDHSKVKRSILGDFQCSAANSAQIYPHASSDSNKTLASRDLLLELDSLRELLRESKERELKLKSEVLEYKSNPRVLELEREVEVSKRVADDLSERVGLLEAEKTRLSEQLVSLSSSIGESQDQASSSRDDHENLTPINGNLEMEIVELRRLNKELQLQKRTLACQLSSAEAQLAALEKISQSEIVAKVQAEASMLRHMNENLSKQVEGLQMSRLTEVEELVYLRWVNSCLRNELHNSGSSTVIGSDKEISPSSIERDNDTFVSSYSLGKETMEFDSGKRLSLVKKLKKWPITEDDLSNLECPNHFLDKNWGEETQDDSSPRRRHSISGSNCSLEESLASSKRRQSYGFICSKDVENEGDPFVVSAQKFEFGDVRSPRFFLNRLENNKISGILDVEKRALRIPNPPPRPSGSVPSVKEQGLAPIPPPPPPPPPPPMKFSARNSTSMVQRAPQVVEFYHTLMKRESRKDSSGGGICDAPDVANVRSNMIDEIENRSSYLLAIKADVETQGEFVNSLIREVNSAVYQDIEDVVAFVKWLDDELCFLVDERAVLKHFDWPEKKADTLREAAFAYRDLKKLESEVSYHEDDPRVPCETALKKMVSLSEKMERSVYNILRTRDALMRHCKEFRIPTDWMLDIGIISKIKFGSVKLAKKYMKRVAMELQSKRATEKDPSLEYMLLQGVRFAFRIHQFAGGFDAETMHAFEELRSLAYDISQL